jgi:hypothetical protein
VEHAFSQDELNGKSIWQQCCVAAVLDGELCEDLVHVICIFAIGVQPSY